MAMNLKWSQHFQKELVEFEAKYKSSKTTLSPLGYALTQKIIPPDQYLKWAQSAYHLPAISDDYFNTSLPSIDDWKAWKSEFQWSEEIVPIGLWDGHLLVACLEIPARFPASLYPVFLLTDFKNTQRTYQFYINSEKGSASARKLKELIQQPEPVAAKPLKKEPEILELSDSETSAEENIVAEDELPVIEEQPEGLILNFTAEPVASNTPTKPAPTSTEFSFESIDSSSSPAPEEISLKFTNVEVNSSLSQKKTVSENTNGFTNTGMTSAVKAGSLTMTTIGKNLPSSIQNEIAQGLPYFIALKKDNPTNFENLTQGTFAKAGNLFDKFIVIAVDPSERNAVPVSWSDSITPRSKDLEKLDLTAPSIFKTVATTLKSYHGYIVLNESNEKFFEFWNQGQVPGNITMVPLIVRNKLVGMWMGLGESSTYNWNTLKQMEAKGKELCEGFRDMYKDPNEVAA